MAWASVRVIVQGSDSREGKPYMSQHTPPLQAAYRYLNLIRNKPKRCYGFLYLAWLREGATGLEPQRGTLSVMGAQAVRMQLLTMLGENPLMEARP